MKKIIKKVWHFLWEDNSVLSWIVNVILAFVIIKFLVYPALGFLLFTSNPIVAVVSCSMEHSATDCGRGNGYMICGTQFDEHANLDFDEYWKNCGKWYEEKNISKESFSTYIFSKGFNKGDLIIIKGKKPGELKAGDVIVFKGTEKDPVIHRIVSISSEGGSYVFSTKGDNNDNQLSYEKTIPSDLVIGKALIKLPYLGNVKILFANMISWLG